MENKEEILLFDEEEYLKWKEEWKNMPEFSQENLQPIQQIIISFETKEDVQKFANLINQKVTSFTKSIWYPEIKIEKPSSKRYVDES